MVVTALESLRLSPQRGQDAIKALTRRARRKRNTRAMVELRKILLQKAL